jgi:hypothetical protein
MMKTNPSDAEIGALMEAASKVGTKSPAWATVTYHRLRLMINSGRAAEARAELGAIFPKVEEIGSDSTVNMFKGLRMRTGATLESALADAPRKILERTSEEQSSLGECLNVMKNPKRMYDCKKDTSPVEFSEDAAGFFNNEMPMPMLAQAAKSNAIPEQLRQSVAMMTWVRSVLLRNETIAAEMFPLLPLKLQQQAGAGVGLHPMMAILRNPGLRPYLVGGVQRSLSYDFVESYSDNWWCSIGSNNNGAADAGVRARPVAFLSAQARQDGEKETVALLALGSGEEYLGAQVLKYADGHPADPDVPEALYLTLRAIRYGCDHGADQKGSDGVGAIAREVGAMMRRRYAANGWTKKAAPYVWLTKTDG